MSRTKVGPGTPKSRPGAYFGRIFFGTSTGSRARRLRFWKSFAGPTSSGLDDSSGPDIFGSISFVRARYYTSKILPKFNRTGPFPIIHRRLAGPSISNQIQGQNQKKLKLLHITTIIVISSVHYHPSHRQKLLLFSHAVSLMFLSTAIFLVIHTLPVQHQIRHPVKLSWISPVPKSGVSRVTTIAPAIEQ